MPDQTLLGSCAQGDQPCYEQAFGNLAYYEGPKNALVKFDDAIEANPDVRANCHRIVHMIGSASLQRYEGDVAKAFAAGSASCWSGYYHGILERSFAGVKSPDEVKEIARGICDDPEISKTTFLLYQCVHGLGHGLMIYRGYDLPLVARRVRLARRPTGTRAPAPAASSWRTSRRATASSRSGCATTTASSRAGR